MTVRKTPSGAWEAGLRIRRRFSSKGVAMRMEARYLAAIADVDKSEFSAGGRWCRIRDKIGEFLTDRMEGAGRLPCTPETAQLHRKRLLAFDRAFHSKTLDGITRQEVEAWRNRRRLKVVGGQRIQRETVNIELRILFAFAKWAQKKGYAPPNLPLQTADILWGPGKMAGRNRLPPFILPIGELLHVIQRIKDVREDAGLVLEGMFLFLLRPAGVCRLSRRDVCLPRDGGAGTLRVAGLKKRPDRTLFFSAGTQADAWVRRCLAAGEGLAGGEPLVACVGGGGAPAPRAWTTAMLDGAVKRAVKSLGLPDRFTPYTIRHSTVAYLHSRPGVTLAEVRTAMDHARITTQEFYEHVTAGEGEAIYRCLDGIFAAAKQQAGG